MEIDKSIKVGDIAATNASNVEFQGQRVFGEVSEIDFNGGHEGFRVDLKLNKKLFNGHRSICAYPYDEPGRPYEDAYLVKATPEECEAHRTGVMRSKKDFWFKKGVWYVMGSAFRKCNKDSDHNVPYSERISLGKHEVLEGIAYWSKNDAIEADMNEVSKYLPDGHPDKVKIQEEKTTWLSDLKYVVGVDPGFSYTAHRKATEYGCVNYSRRNINVGTFYEVIACPLINENTKGFVCRDPKTKLDYLVAAQGVRKACQKDIDKFLYGVDDPKEELFELPEKWKIKVTSENAEMITKWKRAKGFECHAKEFSCVLDNGGGNFEDYSAAQAYTTITDEQFKKWVLKEECGTPLESKASEEGHHFQIDDTFEPIVKAPIVI